MKFSAVSIRPSSHNPGRLEVHFWNLPGDRTSKPTSPNSHGFYYYPRSTSPHAAFYKLKSYLIDKLEVEMKRMGDELEQLRSLTAEGALDETD
jgi:hypothetical protein